MRTNRRAEAARRPPMMSAKVCIPIYIRLKVLMCTCILKTYTYTYKVYMYIQGVKIYTFCILPATDEGTPADGDCNPE